MYVHFQEVAGADGRISAMELQQVLKTIGQRQTTKKEVFGGIF
jgi:Ca2+-binding EF-hand superfamily protein